MAEPLDPFLQSLLADAAKRRGIPEQDEGRKRGRPPGPNYTPPPLKPPPPILASDEAAMLRTLIQEKLRRKIEGLRLYKPLPLQRAFHESNAKERLIRGANRSGKTTAAAVEFARAVTGEDERYPSEGIAYLCGKDGKAVAGVLYKLLFKPGAFKIIRDLETEEWRAYNPSDPEDLKRMKEARPSPALIPKRFVKSTAWLDKKAGEPSMVLLHNGWELWFFSSNSAPPHGTQIDLAWFDEEILNQLWYSEIAARLVDRNGRFIWSATPQAGTLQLYELHERADKEAATLPVHERTIEEFHVTLKQNDHITEAQRRDFISKLNADEILVRVEGEFAAHGLRVYPEFGETTHVVPFFVVPNDWTTYVGIDPGRQVCAALFMAIPPSDDFAYIFDELYLHQCSAAIFGREMRKKCRGRSIEAFVIDHQEGRKADTGSGLTVEDQYSAALQENGIKCWRTGYDFTPGAADPEGGIEAVRGYLSAHNGPPKLRILAGMAPMFIWEMKRYWYEKKDGMPTDKPRSRGPVHLCACIRYIIQDGPTYQKHEVKTTAAAGRAGSVWMAAQKLMNPKGRDGSSLNLGPGQPTLGISHDSSRF